MSCFTDLNRLGHGSVVFSFFSRGADVEKNNNFWTVYNKGSIHNS